MKALMLLKLAWTESSPAAVAAASLWTGAALFSSYPPNRRHSASKPLSRWVLKIVVAAAIAGTSAIYVIELALPDGTIKHGMLIYMFPSEAISSGPIGSIPLIGLNLRSAPVSRWTRIATGDAWLERLISIPIFAILLFAFTGREVDSANGSPHNRSVRWPAGRGTSSVATGTTYAALALGEVLSS